MTGQREALAEALRAELLTQAQGALDHIARQGRLLPHHRGEDAATLAEYAGDCLRVFEARLADLQALTSEPDDG